MDDHKTAERVARRFQAGRLTLGPGRVDAKATESLRGMKKIPARNDGTFNSAVMSAGFYAQKAQKTMWVYHGNAYMSALFRVSFQPSEYLSPINNTGPKVVSVDPDLTVTFYDVKR